MKLFQSLSLFSLFHVLNIFHIIHKFLSRCFPISEVCIPSSSFFFGSLTLFTHASQIFFILFKPFSLPGTGELKGKLHNKSAFNFIFSDFFSVRHSQKKDDTKKFATRPNWNVNTTETRKWAKFCSWREEKRGKSRKIRRVSMCGWREENERKCREWCINI